MLLAWVNLAYLLAAVLFIVGLKLLSHPRTAVRGNMCSALGMLIAVVVTLLDRQIIDFRWIIAGLVVGSVIGLTMAMLVPMTGMPQMVALLNGLGGGASLMVAGAALHEELIRTAGSAAVTASVIPARFAIATALSGLIGAVTWWGSLVAFGKLQGLVSEKSVRMKAHYTLTVVIALVAILLAGVLVAEPGGAWAYWALLLAASLLGVLLVMPIGGADMPVVISLLNSYSGLAAAATGFVLSNTVLIIAGALVGASGIILTRIMCKAMNRSFLNVLFGGMGGETGGPQASSDDVYGGKVKSTDPDEIAMLLADARRVVIVPGYGMAVSQAQHAVRELGTMLEERGITVEYAIHPVAGRMPGHMNVLLAEADVSYDKLREMDDINPTFPETDVVIVIGANDVVNSLARTDPKSPIAGMPILDVDKARTIIVVKRSLSPGFAGLHNPLFAADNCLMFFSDGKKAIVDIITAVKNA